MKSRMRNLYLIPYGMWMALFVVVPILLVGYYSLFDIDGRLTIANYQRFFSPIYLGMHLGLFGMRF